MEKVKLGDLTNIRTGKLDVNAENLNGQYPFFTCSKNHTYIDDYAFDGESILVAGNGDLNVKYYNGKFNAYQRTYVIQPKDILFGKYLYYFLDSYIYKLREQAIGGVIKYIKLGNLTDAEIPLPSLTEQKAIAEKLDKAQEIIRYNEEIIAQYDALTQSLFLDMFGDIKSNIKFSIGKISDIVDIIRDGPHVSPNYSESGFPILSTRNIRPYTLVMEDLKFVSEETYELLTKRFKPTKGDVLLTKGGTTGFAKIVDWDWDFCIWVHLAILRVKENVNPKYLESALNSFYGYNQSQEKTRGIANKDLGLTRIVDIKLPIPPIELQNQFAERVSAIEAQKQLAQKSLEQSQNLFNSLLQESFAS